jgi:hypothetical protein
MIARAAPATSLGLMGGGLHASAASSPAAAISRHGRGRSRRSVPGIPEIGSISVSSFFGDQMGRGDDGLDIDELEPDDLEKSELDPRSRTIVTHHAVGREHRSVGAMDQASRSRTSRDGALCLPRLT